MGGAEDEAVEAPSALLCQGKLFTPDPQFVCKMGK